MTDAKGKTRDQKHRDHVGIVRMLPCIPNNTTPDIIFAARSQAAQHSACPKGSHARAVKCINRHLAGAAEERPIIKHDGTFELKAQADADHAGAFRQELSGNAKAAKLRHRHVMTFGGVSLVWEMIPEICLSTTHADCAGLSNSLQTLTRMRDPIKDTLEQRKLAPRRNQGCHAKCLKMIKQPISCHPN